MVSRLAVFAPARPCQPEADVAAEGVELPRRVAEQKCARPSPDNTVLRSRITACQVAAGSAAAGCLS